MKIEIAEPGRMTQSGSSLLKLIQNNDMPILDLFIRESVQNSLDAKNDIDKYVTVKFRTGSFNRSKINNEFEGITEALNERYSEEEYEYISIADTNTVGLTGKLHYDDLSDNDYGNLLKLIYEISKPQNAEGAGGSWGLGKTIYFRLGIGMVLYYSRIRKESGEHESRMAACLVEDENSPNSLIPKYKGKSKRGIAWWGEKIGENKTKPITDTNQIKLILDIFNIQTYQDDETGTTIIIPYINHSKLLSNNQIEYTALDGKSMKPYWHYNIEDYIKISLQRWYSPRLNNINYPYGKFLRASINSNGVTKDSMEIVFKIIQSLYNRAVTNGKEKYDDILNEADVKVEKIILRNVLKNGEAGILCFMKVNRKFLKMEYPNNKPSPYEYFNCMDVHGEKNKPIVTFTRKPGMLVTYENLGPWTDSIPLSDNDSYIIGVFVLNSENELTGNLEKCLLEEYVRRGEMADHASWNDFSFKNNNPRIISKIQWHVRNKISKEFMEYDEYEIRKKSSGLGKIFGDLLLPPENFGKKPSVSLKNRKKSKYVEKRGDVLFSIEKDNIRYMKDGVEVKASVIAKNKVSNIILCVGVDSEGGTITFEQWEAKMRMKFPFNIEYIKIKLITSKDEALLDSVIILDQNNLRHSYDDLDINQLNKNNNCYGLKIMSKDKNIYSVECSIKVKMKRRDFKPAFIIETNGGEQIMAAAISSFPMITGDMLNDISLEMSEYSFRYIEKGEKNFLYCEKISDDSEIYMLNDTEGIWNPDEYNFGLNREYKFSNYYVIFGENGVACSDSVVGVAVVWTSADSKQRGIIDVGEIHNTYEELYFSTEYFFNKAQLRGDIEFTTIIYIKDEGNPLYNEQHLANSCGCIVGEIDKFYLRLDGAGSMFPIYEINQLDKPLWYLSYEWEDPKYDYFSECVSIYINTGHKNYKYLDKTKRTYNEQLLKEIMASALTIVISKLRSETLWDSIVSGTAEVEDGSIAQAVNYFITTLLWDISKPELLSYSIRKFFDERM